MVLFLGSERARIRPSFPPLNVVWRIIINCEYEEMADPRARMMILSLMVRDFSEDFSMFTILSNFYDTSIIYFIIL